MGPSMLRQEVLRSHGPGQAGREPPMSLRAPGCSPPKKAWDRWSRWVTLLYLSPPDSPKVLPQIVHSLVLPREMLAEDLLELR